MDVASVFSPSSPSILRSYGLTSRAFSDDPRVKPGVAERQVRAAMLHLPGRGIEFGSSDFISNVPFELGRRKWQMDLPAKQDPDIFNLVRVQEYEYRQEDLAQEICVGSDDSSGRVMFAGHSGIFEWDGKCCASIGYVAVKRRSCIRRRGLEESGRSEPD